MEKRHCLAENNFDRISYLPRSIRSHIVSFLPLMDAVRTSIHSRRWKDVCSSLSKLDFGCFDLLRKRSMEGVKDVIDQMLILHDGSDVQYLKLDIEVDGEDICLHHVNRWISFAISHNVLDLFLHLNLITRVPVMLPCSLFTSSTLSELGLFEFDLKLPTIMHFPVLKTLSFGWITFSDEFLTNKLFSDSCCPMLETLEIKNCKLDHITSISISATNLKFVKLKDPHHGIIFNLSNPNLCEIRFKGNKLPEISLKALSSFFIATFELVLRPCSCDVMENLVSKILMGLHNVGTLRLRGYEIELLTRVKKLSACLPSPCCGLKHLYLTIDPTKNQLLVETFLLKSYPNLQKLWLCFNEEKRVSLNMLCMEEHWHSEVRSTGYVLKHLRIVEIKQFQGSESELEFVKYLLENANTMEDVNIGFSCKKKVIEGRTSITEKVLTFARVSPHARIFLS